MCLFIFFFFKQKTAYEMRISDWSSDVCSSDLRRASLPLYNQREIYLNSGDSSLHLSSQRFRNHISRLRQGYHSPESARSEEHTSELQSLMRITYAVFCLKKKNKIKDKKTMLDIRSTHTDTTLVAKHTKKHTGTKKSEVR